MILDKMLSFRLYLSQCYSSYFLMFFFFFFLVSPSYEGFIPLYNPSLLDPISTCLSSSTVFEFPLPFLQLFDSLGIKMTFNTVKGFSPHKCGQESSYDAFNAVVAAFS